MVTPQNMHLGYQHFQISFFFPKTPKEYTGCPVLRTEKFFLEIF